MPKSSSKINNESAISVERLNVTFDQNVILEDVTFSVAKGNIVAVIGPNGSGKSTLIKAILGLVHTKSGDMRIFGKHLHEARHMIGYVPQKFHFDRHFPITVKEFLQLALHKHAPAHQIEEKIKEVGLMPAVLNQLIGTLSGGQLQRVLIAQAILNNPSLLILDEPAAGIDIAGEATFYDIVEHLNHDHDTTVLLVSHDISMISQHVDQVICLNKKMMCSGPPKKALSAKTMKEVFGDKHVYHHHH
jgi:zinc transport system ATP-binding protein